MCGTCPGKFKCSLVQRCLPNNNVCDGFDDCPDGDDELNCENWKCSEGYWKCSDNRQCIDQGNICNGMVGGFYDCSDGSDELNCSRTVCAPDTL